MEDGARPAFSPSAILHPFLKRKKHEKKETFFKKAESAARLGHQSQNARNPLQEDLPQEDREKGREALGG
jgi:hypothetical protein